MYCTKLTPKFTRTVRNTKENIQGQQTDESTPLPGPKHPPHPFSLRLLKAECERNVESWGRGKGCMYYMYGTSR